MNRFAGWEYRRRIHSTMGSVAVLFTNSGWGLSSVFLWTREMRSIVDLNRHG